MKHAPGILNVLFPRVRAEMLRLLFDAPQNHRYVRELAGMSGLALRTVQEELAKLSAAGLVTSWSNGYHRFYRANRDHPLFSEFLRIVRSSQQRRPLPQGSRLRVSVGTFERKGSRRSKDSRVLDLQPVED